MKQLRIKLSQLEEKSKLQVNPEKWLKEELKKGIVKDDVLYINEPNRPRIKGLGSLIAIPAQAIAKTIDKLSAGRTNVAGCSSCQKRKENWDQLIPF